jgi:DegV family protein with EDD domain
MSVGIVTDSAAYLDPGIVQALDIHVVPFEVQIGQDCYQDGVNLDAAGYYDLVRQYDDQVRVVPPPTQAFYQTYVELSQTTTEILSIHPPEALTPAIRHAQEAARMLLGRCQIVVLDSQTISLGLGLLVEQAARAAKQDQSFDDIMRLVRGLVPRVYVVFFSENLEYLKRGGRIGEAQALLGTMLGIKPFLTLEGGAIQPMEKVRTREEALEKLVEFVSEFDDLEKLAIIRGMNDRPDEIALLHERFEALFPQLEVPVLYYGPVLAAHIGPDNLGVIVYEALEFEE